MVAGKQIIGLVGSPNPTGRTDQLVTAALDGARQAGASTELIQISEHLPNACQDCLPWVCKDNLKCTYDDEGFDYLRHKIIDCGGLVLGTPVYWWDVSGMVKYLILKMFRLYAMSGPLHGLPVVGLAIAGGTGNGLISGLRPLYHFFQVLQMRALKPVPSTRFNFMESLDQARHRGQELAAMAGQRHIFSSLDERLKWYDDMAYVNLDRAEERRLLTGLVTEAVPADKRGDIQSGLAKAEVLAASGHKLESMIETSRVYEAAVEIYNDLERTGE